MTDFLALRRQLNIATADMITMRSALLGSNAKTNPSTLTAKKSSPTKGELFLFGTIGQSFWGDGVSADQFNKQLRELGAVKEIDLYLNSDGGVVTDARAMYNSLVKHEAKVTVHIEGVAASAASFLAMAGDKITIAEGAFFMIHNARGIVMGEAKDMRARADLLETLNRTIVDTYAARTGLKRTDLAKWMDAETWYTGAEAVEKGFATDMIPNKTANKNSASFAVNLLDLRSIAACIMPEAGYVNTPMALRPRRNKAVGVLNRIRGVC